MALMNHAPRPSYIFTRSLLRLDHYLFDIHSSVFGSISCLFCLVAGAWILYVRQFTFNLLPEWSEISNSITTVELDLLESPSSPTSSDSIPSGSTTNPTSFEEDSLRDGYKYPGLDDDDNQFLLGQKLQLNNLDNSRLIEYLNSSGTNRPYGCWNLAAPLLLAFSWIILNILYSTKSTISKPRNLIAWIFFVVLQFTIPPFIALWLYLFHRPGALKLFTISLGIQNILIVLTHFALPSAPPLFLQLYGEAKEPDYDMLYTDGITRQDMKFGNSIYRAVYYAAPNKFASLPSVHASMSSLIFLFVTYYGEWKSFKIVTFVYLCGQWWSVLYLDHHWRIDVLIGLIYSISVWVYVRNWKHGINTVDERFIKSRLEYDFSRGSTMGMRLFKGTSIQSLFDPLA